MEQSGRQGGLGGFGFTFLSADFRSVRTPVRPVNVFELSGFPRWETVASRVFAYFLDPRDPRHGLGSLAADALLELLDGATTIAVNGNPSRQINTAFAVGSSEWIVETEATTDDGNRIDILMTNDEHDMAIIIENKLDAPVTNPFASYAMRAAAAHGDILCVVLAPTRRTVASADSKWISGAITYDDFFERMTVALKRVDNPDPRSVDLLTQFIENTSEKEQRVSGSAEAEMLERFWTATTGDDKQLGEFFRALSRVNTILRRRAEALDPLIREELANRNLLKDHWLVSGNDRAWGRSDGRVAIVYVAYELASGNCVELLVGQYPGKEWTGFALKAYSNRRRPGATYSDFDHVPLSIDWSDADVDIAAEFLRFVDMLESAHPRR